MIEEEAAMREPAGEPTVGNDTHVVGRPKRALEERQAKANTRPCSSLCRGVDMGRQRYVESHREQKTDDKSNTYNIKELTEVLDVFSVLWYFLVSRVVLGFFQ